MHPADHYAMGGILTDHDGAAKLPGLYAAGEAAYTGAHGANRLASNSLLEGLVFGARGIEVMRMHTGNALRNPTLPRRKSASARPGNAIANLPLLAWCHAGIARSSEGLRGGLEQLDLLSTMLEKGLARNSRRGFETGNMY